MTRGSEALFVHAPDAAQALCDIEAAVWEDATAAGRSDLVELMSRVCASVTGLDPLTPPVGLRPGAVRRGRPGRMAIGRRAQPSRAPPPSGSPSSSRTTCRRSREEQRARPDPSPRRPISQRGGDRVRHGLPAPDLRRPRRPVRCPPHHWPDRVGPDHPPTAHPAGGLWGALDLFTRTVPQLDAVDPVTTELVRLRGARQHQCRICSSLRSRPALVAGADEDTFSSVDDFEHSDLSVCPRRRPWPSPMPWCGPPAPSMRA